MSCSTLLIYDKFPKSIPSVPHILGGKQTRQKKVRSILFMRSRPIENALSLILYNCKTVRPRCSKHTSHSRFSIWLLWNTKLSSFSTHICKGMETEHAVKKAKKNTKQSRSYWSSKMPRNPEGARQKWFKFHALWFWRHVHDCMWREQKHVCPRVAGNWSCSCNNDSRPRHSVKSSWKYRLLCCCVTRDVTQSNVLQEGLLILLFSVSCFVEEVIFFIYFLFMQENRKRARADSELPCPLSATYLVSLRYLSQTVLGWKT